MSESSKAVFLSYASQDAEAARRICEALRAAGVPVWLDADGGLEHGDEWDAKIRRQIKECVLFIPLISANTQARHEGYFRIEWELAAQRALGIASGVAFILPVVIDDTREPDALVPDKFRAVQWTRLRPSGFAGQARQPGELPPEVLQRFLKLWSHRAGVLKHEATVPLATVPTQTLVRAGSGRRTLFAAGVVLLAGGAWFWFSRSAAPATQNPESKTLNSAASAAAPAALPPLPTDKSIAVLPFGNMSDDKAGSAFFSDGVQEDTLTNLQQIRAFRVASPEAVLDYRDSRKPIAQIARELRVAYVVTGNVRRAGNQVVVTGRLIAAANGEVLWTNRYDRNLADIFAVQSEIAKEIAAALRTTLSPTETALVDARPTGNTRAYDLILEARAVIREQGNSREALRREESLAQAAVALDPDYTDAWGSLARAIGISYAAGDDRSPARLARLRQAVETLNRLRPGSTVALRGASSLYNATGDNARYLAAAEQLEKMEPGKWSGLVAVAYSRLGRVAEAAAAGRKAVVEEPDARVESQNLIGYLQAGRRYDEAAAELRRWMGLKPGALSDGYSLGRLAFRATGRTAEGDRFLAALTPEQVSSGAGAEARKSWAFVTGNATEYGRVGETGPAGAAIVNERSDFLTREERDAIALIVSGDLAGGRARLPDVAVLRMQFESDPTHGPLLRQIARSEALLGHEAEAVQAARRAVELQSPDTLEGRSSRVALAFVYAWTGDKDRALAEYSQLLRVPNAFLNVQEMRRSLAYFPLRGDQRWEALLNDPANNAPLF